MRSLKPHPCVSPSFRWWQLHSHVSVVPCIPETIARRAHTNVLAHCYGHSSLGKAESSLQPLAHVPSSVLMGCLRVVVNTREPRLKFRTAGDVLAWACLPLTSRPAPDWKIQHCRAAVFLLWDCYVLITKAVLLMRVGWRVGSFVLLYLQPCLSLANVCRAPCASVACF